MSEVVTDTHVQEPATRVVHEGIFGLEVEFQLACEIYVKSTAEVESAASGMVVVVPIIIPVIIVGVMVPAPAVQSETCEGIYVESPRDSEGELDIDTTDERRLAIIAEHVSDFRRYSDMRSESVMEIKVGIATPVIRGVTTGETESLFTGLGGS